MKHFTAREFYFSLMKLAYRHGRMNVYRWLMNRYKKEANIS